MIAEIIVDHRAKQTDKAFDYLIPPGADIKIGSRVVVPFGNHNTEREGFCVGIKEKTKAKKLKELRLTSDTETAFDEKMLEVIEYMHERYLSLYQEIIHTIIPAGTALKSTEWIILMQPKEKQSKKRERIVRILRENGGEMESAALSAMFETDIRVQLSDMIAGGELRNEYRQKREVREKTQRIARLAITTEDAAKAVDIMGKRAPVQARMLEILSSRDSMTTADLERLAEGSSSAVAALYKKGFIELFDMHITRDDFLNREVEKSTPPPLTREQYDAVFKINSALSKGEFKPFLLYGVTGSGKTEVFMQVIEKAAAEGKTALVLVPEISLTPQTVARFLARFGRRIAVLHSRLSMGERYDQWMRIKSGEADIVIGARSAVFAPLDNIGVIVIDEEHSDTYKSEMAPRYHAKEIALFRARQYGAAVVLASATPSVEDFFRAKTGEFELLRLMRRYNDSPMPAIMTVDMRGELAKGNRSMFSSRLRDEINRNLEKHEQTILLLNRRGFSTFVSCRSCGYVPECPRCSISLTYHKYENNLQCHYCGYEMKNPTKCPVCQSPYIRYFGSGTQKVEEEIEKLFPVATVLRMDIDTTRRKLGHERILERFEREKTDILIGTQMVAKGLDFENVTLVGVITADTLLHVNDFRSSERTFSLLEQVCGRAGRGKKRGRAIIQTYTPENAAIKLAAAHDYERFYAREIAERERMWYPPFSKIICVMFHGNSEVIVSRAAKYFIRCMGDANGEQIHLLGPIPSALAKVKNVYHWQILIKCGDDDSLNGCLIQARKMCAAHDVYKDVLVIIDKNPNSVY